MKKIRNYEIFSGEDLKIADLIQRRRYQILVNSCIYYHLHSTVVDNSIWDAWAKELVELQKKYPDISKQVRLYEEFEDFDGSTGFDLPIEEPWVVKKANLLLNSGSCTSINYYKPTIKQKSSKKPVKRRLF